MDEVRVDNGLPVDGTAQTLVAALDCVLEQLPEDWSHLLVEVELQPDMQYESIAPTVSALNPERCDQRAAFRFRIGREFGYGTSSQMVRHCLGLLDEAQVEGRLRLLQMLSQRRPIETQGPVWRLGGHSL